MEQEPENPDEILAEGEQPEESIVRKPRSKKELYDEIRAISNDLFYN